MKFIRKLISLFREEHVYIPQKSENGAISWVRFTMKEFRKGRC